MCVYNETVYTCTDSQAVTYSIHIILTNIVGKIIISRAVKTWSKMLGINSEFTLLPIHVITWWFSILSLPLPLPSSPLSLYIYMYILFCTINVYELTNINRQVIKGMYLSWQQTCVSSLQRVSNLMPCKMWDEITYPYPNFTGVVCGWISNLISNYILWMWLLIHVGSK